MILSEFTCVCHWHLLCRCSPFATGYCGSLCSIGRNYSLCLRASRISQHQPYGWTGHKFPMKWLPSSHRRCFVSVLASAQDWRPPATCPKYGMSAIRIGISYPTSPTLISSLVSPSRPLLPRLNLVFSSVYRLLRSAKDCGSPENLDTWLRSIWRRWYVLISATQSRLIKR